MGFTGRHYPIPAQTADHPVLTEILLIRHAILECHIAEKRRSDTVDDGPFGHVNGCIRVDDDAAIYGARNLVYDGFTIFDLQSFIPNAGGCTIIAISIPGAD